MNRHRHPLVSRDRAEKGDKSPEGPPASVRLAIEAGGMIFDARPSPDGRMIAVACKDGQLK